MIEALPVTLTGNTSESITCKVTRAGKISAGLRFLPEFSTTIPVPTGYLLDTRKTTANKKNGIQWTLLTQLHDLCYADDLIGSPFA